MKKIYILTFFLFLLVSTFAQKKIYVDASNMATVRNGNSWATAYRTFEGAIYDPTLSVFDTIFVAKGTYQPSKDSISFWINKPFLTIIGGFPSGGGTLAQRNWQNDSTILLGRMNSVIAFGGSYIYSTFDGFYITGGDAEIGGGINTNVAGLNNTIQNCVIYNNKSRIWSGGGMINYEKDSKLINVVFKGNINTGGTGGGALDNRGKNLLLQNVEFIDNSNVGKIFAAGGALINEGDNVHLQNVLFKGNTTYADSGTVDGGALRNMGDNMLLENVVFENNTATSDFGNSSFGGALANLGDNMILQNVTFDNNTVIATGLLTEFQVPTAYGGALYSNGSRLTLHQVSFNENKAIANYGTAIGGGIYIQDENTLTEIENTTFTKNMVIGGNSFNGGGMTADVKNIRLRNVQFIENSLRRSDSIGLDDNVYGIFGAGMNCSAEIADLQDVKYYRNSIELEYKNIDPSGGGLYINAQTLKLKNADFIGNSIVNNDTLIGGGINGGGMVIRTVNANLDNILVKENTIYKKGGAMFGAGIYIDSYGDNVGNVNISQLKIIENKAIGTTFVAGAGLFSGANANLNIENSILKDNKLQSIYMDMTDVEEGGMLHVAGGLGVGGAQTTKVTNTLFIGNGSINTPYADNAAGSAIFGISSEEIGEPLNIEVINCTFVNNEIKVDEVAEDGILAGAIIGIVDEFNIKNSVFWNNTVNGQLQDILNAQNMTINNSYFANAMSASGDTIPGSGNINDTLSPFRNANNPEGADGTLGTPDDGLVLACGAVAINAGDDAYLSNTITKDLVGLNRFNGTIDMGAYEFNGTVDNTDSVQACTGTPYAWHGTDYSEPGTYTFQNGTDGNGCPLIDVLIMSSKQDSVIITENSVSTTCVDVPLTALIANTQNITGITTQTGLPNGITASYSNDSIILSGVPADTGQFQYKISLEGCGNPEILGWLIVKPKFTIQRDVPTQTACYKTPIDTIFIPISNVNAINYVTGLPQGLSFTFFKNRYLKTQSLYIYGAPLESGTFNYEVHVLGDCGDDTVFARGTINVLPNVIGAPSVDAQNICINTPIAEITFNVPDEITGIYLKKALPPGVDAVYSNHQIIISGTPTKTGTYRYDVFGTGACGVASGVIYVTGELRAKDSAANATVCLGNVMDSIIIKTENVEGITNVQNLPEGVSINASSSEVILYGTPTTAGIFNYSFTLIGVCGTFDVSGTIKVGEPFDAQIVIVGDTLKVTQNDANYQWITCNGEIIDGATAQTYSPDSSGNYAVIVTNYNGCADTSECVAFILTAIKNDIFKETKVFPNPTYGTVNIDFGRSLEQCVIRVTDVIGNIVLQQTVNNQTTTQLSIDNVANGIYFLYLKTKNNDEMVYKILKN
ncbi:MAG: T9SS type A sorting domain-containing protein [Sphingobacteriales bacterium]|nr:MAG: T9SS type A sorting domain-containing protein [Sphingobacteriales bacterium]